MHHPRAAQGEVRETSKSYGAKKLYTLVLFITSIVEQLGQVAEKYLHKGRSARGIRVGIADIIVRSLAYLDWLKKGCSIGFYEGFGKA